MEHAGDDNDLQEVEVSELLDDAVDKDQEDMKSYTSENDIMDEDDNDSQEVGVSQLLDDGVDEVDEDIMDQDDNDESQEVGVSELLDDTADENETETQDFITEPYVAKVRLNNASCYFNNIMFNKRLLHHSSFRFTYSLILLLLVV